ncbi:LysR family transcriptional regulator [Sorangium sp. So ce394]|uniref:LysR family transcriptional regulator n=1 Tax=Sorangium sp. So ce394 TaxID=3133310 RepID=UPI003F5C0AC7
MISLPQIQAFIEVARSGSFAAASQHLSLPRSTVSARVRALEARLNVRLLHRTTRRVTLTDEGRSYMEQCEAAIDVLTKAESQLTRSNELAGTIRLTVPLDMPKPALARLLGAFIERHPGIRVETVVSDELLNLVAHNIDLALRGGSPGTLGVVARKLGEGGLAFHASPEYIKTRRVGKTLVHLHEHAIYDPAQRLRRRARSSLQPAPLSTRNFELAKTLALQGRGIALLPESLCAEEVKSGALARLSSIHRVPALPLYLVMPSRAHVPARVRALVDFITDPGNVSSLL